MPLDPEIIKKLMVTFQAELDEQLQVITKGLLSLEKNPSNDIIETIFRAAHNIKGSARSLGLTPISEMAHAIESVFNGIQKKTLSLNTTIINSCLETVDKIRLAMESYRENRSLPFDLNTITQNLTQFLNSTSSEIKKIPEKEEKKAIPKNPELLHTDTIRITVEQIDKLSALMETMQNSKLAVDDFYSELTKINHKVESLEKTWKNIKTYLNSLEKKSGHTHFLETESDDLLELKEQTSHLYKRMKNKLNEFTFLNETLQEEVRTLRLIPADALLSTFPRYVRDLAQELNKKIDFSISGGDVKLDKVILEALKDPLIHLLRNAVDHGIESSESRVQQGKNATGNIKIDISEGPNQINLKIIDDGGGIDLHHISNVAIEKGLTQSSDHLSDETLLDFIFSPGFSTKKTITDISGRGVGLDVVKTNLNTINGTITVKTEKGKGSTFCLSVPMTLATEKAVIAQCQNQCFAISSHSIAKLLIVDTNKIKYVDATQSLMIDETPIPIRSLTAILNQSSAETIPLKEKASLILLKKDHHTVALLVDEIIGEREIVIKALQKPLNKLPCILGGTLSSDNQVIIVLNGEELCNKALNIAYQETFTMEKSQQEDRQKLHILVVDDSITTRTLEKNILESKNYEVSIAVNGQEAWDLVQVTPYALVITDVSMPLMDGFKLTEKIKRNEKTKSIPVIIVTSLGSDEEKKRGLDAGADAYIVKSEFESETLLDIVNQLV